MPRYGDKTAEILDHYLQNYTMPTGTTRTGLAAPYHDSKRNFDKKLTSKCAWACWCKFRKVFTRNMSDTSYKI